MWDELREDVEWAVEELGRYEIGEGLVRELYPKMDGGSYNAKMQNLRYVLKERYGLSIPLKTFCKPRRD